MITIEDLKIFVIQSNSEEISKYVSDNRDELKLLISNCITNNENNKICQEIITHLHGFKTPEKINQGIQFLFSSLAFYFKRANKSAFVSTCISNLTDTILKYRLAAWHQYKTYTNKTSHINRFASYLEKLSSAISDSQEDYIDDILQDLYTYYKEQEHNPNFQNTFSDATLLSRFSLLREFKKRKTSLEYRIEIHENSAEIFEPSPFTEYLFEKKFIEPIRLHPDTNWHKILMGYDSFAVRSEIIQFGQAEFDNGYKGLSSSDVVKLYCYYNMRKHYFSTLYLLERCSWLKNTISKKGCAKFIDIGCGPATCGVALTDHLLADSKAIQKFDYIGVDYYKSMLAAAEDMMNNDVYGHCSHQDYVHNIQSIKKTGLSNANSIWINACYLFASPSLVIDDLVEDVNSLLNSHSDKPRFFLYQNTTESAKNSKYNQFKKRLIKHEELYSEKVTIKYNTRRFSYYEPAHESVYFEILKF